jgi:hypothetical protein
VGVCMCVVVRVFGDLYHRTILSLLLMLATAVEMDERLQREGGGAGRM